MENYKMQNQEKEKENDNMKKQKLVKGMYGFLKIKRIQVLLFTLVLFGLSFGMYFFGLYHLKTNQSLYTVLAVLGLLPASKSAVKLIMLFRARECDERVYDRLRQIPYEYVLYSVYLTMYKNSVAIDCMHVFPKQIILYTKDEVEEKSVETYLTNILQMQKFASITVKVFTKLEAYETRVQQLQERSLEDQELSKDKLAQVTQLMKQVML